MQLLTAYPHLVTLVVALTDQVPEEKDVKAGWIAFAVFAGLVVAVVFLAFSLTKQLRRVDASAEAGVYGPTDAQAGAAAEGAGAERPDEQA